MKLFGTFDERALHVMQFRSARMNCLLQSSPASIKQLMNTTGLEQVANAQKHLDVIKRFVQKISRPAMQSSAFAFLVHVGGKDDDRQIDLAPLGTE